MAFPPPTYRVYHPSWWLRAFGLFFLIFSAGFVARIGIGVSGAQEDVPGVVILVCVLFFLVGLGMTIHAFTATVRFTEDAIEARSLLGTRKLPLSMIRGRREKVVTDNEGASTRYLQLISDDNRVPSMKFMKSYDFDDAFYRWFNSLRDLDAEDKKIHKDRNFGLV